MRATFNTTFNSLNLSLQRIQREMEDLRVSAATGKKVQKPSDEPTSIRPIFNARTQIKGFERYLTNIETGLNRTDTTDIHLDTMENTMVRVKELAIGAVNGAISAADRDTFANEVAQLKQTMLDQANAKFDGEYLFSGYLVTDASMGGSPPFTESAGVVSYNGDANSTQIDVSPTEKLTIGVPGDTFLQPASGQDVFASLTDLEAALRANDTVAIEAQIGTIETATEQIRVQRSLLGNVGKRLEDARSQTQALSIDKSELLSSLEDADILDVASKLQQQEIAFEAALNVTGKVSQLSILDYI